MVFLAFLVISWICHARNIVSSLVNFFIEMSTVLPLTSVIIFSPLQGRHNRNKIRWDNKFVSLMIARIGWLMSSAVWVQYRNPGIKNLTDSLPWCPFKGQFLWTGSSVKIDERVQSCGTGFFLLTINLRNFLSIAWYLLSKLTAFPTHICMENTKLSHRCRVPGLSIMSSLHTLRHTGNWPHWDHWPAFQSLSE